MSDTAEKDALERITEAAAETVNCIRVLEKSGSNLIADVLCDREFIEYGHYPPGDVCDPETHALYYFHAHPQTRGEWNGYGHFHTFLRPRGMPPGVHPFPVPGTPADETGNDALSHLIAISMPREGRPAGCAGGQRPTYRAEGGRDIRNAQDPVEIFLPCHDRLCDSAPLRRRDRQTRFHG